MFARKNLLKEKAKNGEIIMGMESWLRDPRIFELLGQAGFDLAHIENEHVGHNWEEIENLIRAAELTGMTPLFRCEQTFDGQPPVNQIIKALKCGAQIIMVPQVDSAETAKKIVKAAKFPPIGKRGISTADRSSTEIFPNLSVPDINCVEFAKELNDEIMLWAIIECPEGVKNIESILDVDGIDAVGFGHQDYAVSSGFPSDSGPEVNEAREKIREAALRKNKLMWWNTDQVEEVEVQRKKGIQIFLFSVDTIHIDNLFRGIIQATKIK